MLFVGLSLTLKFSFLFDDENRAQYMLYFPLYYDRIYIACITMFMFTCKHMHSVFNNMTSAAIYFGVCELSYTFYIYLIQTPSIPGILISSNLYGGIYAVYKLATRQVATC
jgi:hypothetical protein